MKKMFMVKESLYENKRGRKRKEQDTKKFSDLESDSFEDLDDEDKDEIDPDNFYLDASDTKNSDEIEIEDEDDIFDDQLLRALNNELKVIEPYRRILIFSTKDDPRKRYYGIPMAKMGNDAFLFKLNNGSLKKFYLKDIIVENENIEESRAKTIFEKTKFLKEDDFESDDEYEEVDDEYEEVKDFPEDYDEYDEYDEYEEDEYEEDENEEPEEDYEEDYES